MVELMRLEFEKRRDLIVKLLNAIPGIDCPKPGGAFYVFPDVSSYYGKKIGGVDVKDSMAFAEVALEKGHIAIVPGGSFGNDKCVRFSYACSTQTIEKGVKRLADLLKG
jgi:aspartate aminotransferase